MHKVFILPLCHSVTLSPCHHDTVSVFFVSLKQMFAHIAMALSPLFTSCTM